MVVRIFPRLVPTCRRSAPVPRRVRQFVTIPVKLLLAERPWECTHEKRPKKRILKDVISILLFLSSMNVEVVEVVKPRVHTRPGIYTYPYLYLHTDRY